MQHSSHVQLHKLSTTNHLTEHLTDPPRLVVTTGSERFQRGLSKIPLFGRRWWPSSLCHILSAFACLPLARRFLDHSAQFNSGKFKLVFFSSNSKHVARQACRVHGPQEAHFQTLKTFWTSIRAKYLIIYLFVPQTYTRDLNYLLIVCRDLSTQFNDTSKAHDATREQSFCENSELMKEYFLGMTMNSTHNYQTIRRLTHSFVGAGVLKRSCLRNTLHIYSKQELLVNFQDS